MILAHKIQLDPTVKQEQMLRCTAGCARFTWNWALSEAEAHYKETGKTVNFNELKKRWNKEKPEWMLESPKDANQQPFTNLRQAYGRFFNKTAKRPKFKSKHKSKDSFYLSNDKFSVDDLKVRIPKIGRVRLTEALRLEGKIMSATVSRTADRWFISISVDTTTTPSRGEEVIGIDLGLKHFATLYTGEVIDAPKPLKKSLERLQRKSRQHSRKQKGSRNRAKSAMRLARLHMRVANQRKDFLHKTTSALVARAKLLVIEDLSVRGMQKLWGRAVGDLGLYEFRRQMEYKCGMGDCGLMEADRWYPSSQLCHVCGGRQKLTLSTRVYACSDCGSTTDRDYNAARNLYSAGLARINACGHEGSDYQHTLVVKPSWLNQELNPCSQVSTH
jgi:putative transposase